MWLTDYVTRNSFSKKQASFGDITAAGSGVVAINTALEHRDIPIVAPYGIAYNPPLSEKSVLLPIDSRQACVGVVCQDKGLEPGELMLFSKGGASIVLKNNGQVVINGRVFE